MPEPWLTVQGRINVASAWAAYAQGRQFYDDVKVYGSMFRGGLGLWTAFKGGRPPGWFGLSARAIASIGDMELKARLTLDALKVSYSTPEVMSFWGELSNTLVQRRRPNGSYATTGLTDWEKYSAVMQRYGGFDPTNIMSFLRRAVDQGAELTKTEIQLYKRLGIDVEAVLTADPREIEKRYPKVTLPPQLQKKIELRVSTNPPRELPGTRPAMESSNPENSRRTSTPLTFNDRWDDLFPAAAFDQRWGAISNPSPQTARSWLDLSQDPAYGNLNPAPAPSQSPQRQEGRRLQDIGVVEPQGQELPPDLPLPRSALAWMNLVNTPLGVLRAAVSPNAPADVWNDVFAGPTFANDVLPAAPDVAGNGGAPVLDAPFEQDPAAPNTNMGAMTSLADLGSGYRNAGLGNSSFGNFADYGTGDFGDYGYGGLDRYGIPIR